jgi:hypothetical protein
MSDQRYVEIPGSKTHELPPLLLHCVTDCVTDLTSVMLEAEDMLASTDAGEEILERRKLDLALQLTQQYKGLLSHWFWGDSVIEWIRQCEITFESEGVLRKLLHPMSGRMPAAPASSNCCAKRTSPLAASLWRRPSDCALRSGSRRRSIASRASSCSI